MTPRVITVFGGTGYLGRVIVRRLSEAGCLVRVAAREPHTLPRTTGTVEPRRADVRDASSVAAALQGADAVVNAVGLYVERDGERFEAVHVSGAAQVARLARRAGATALVHVSGIGADPESASAYVRARARGEQAVRAAFPHAVILRPSVLIGGGDAFLKTLDAVTRLPLVPLFGNGRTRLQPVHVEDVAAACQRALATPAAAGCVFELGGALTYRYRDIVQAVLTHAGRQRPLLPVPYAVWRLLAALASLLPNPPLTRDQIILMRTDNIVGEGVGTFADLDIEPRSLEAVLAARRDDGS